jgi:K+-transporting ATPase KdpF subunit
MNAAYVIAGFAFVALLIYLIVALLKPERFQ